MREPGTPCCRYKNLDKLIHYANLDGRVNAFYSTPAAYTDAKNSYEAAWPLKTDDFFPYADCRTCYWTGDGPAACLGCDMLACCCACRHSGALLNSASCMTPCMTASTTAGGTGPLDWSTCCAGYFTSRPTSKGYIRSSTSFLQVPPACLPFVTPALSVIQHRLKAFTLL